MASLRLSIDASGARTGAAEFERAAGQVQSAATRAGAAVGSGGQAGLAAKFREAEAQMLRTERAIAKADVSLAAAARQSIAAASATDKVTTAQRALGRALDVSGNFAKGFLAALAIGPVIAIGQAIADAAFELVGFGDSAERAADRVRDLTSRADAAVTAFERLKASGALASQYPSSGNPSQLDLAQTRLTELRDLSATFQQSIGVDPRGWWARTFSKDPIGGLSDEQRAALTAAGVPGVDFIGGPSGAVSAIQAQIREQERLIESLSRPEATSAYEAYKAKILEEDRRDAGRLRVDPSQRAYDEYRDRVLEEDRRDAATLRVDPAQRAYDEYRDRLLEEDRRDAAQLRPDITAQSYDEYKQRILEDDRRDAGLAYEKAQQKARAVGETFANSMEQALFSARSLGEGIQSIFAATLQAIFHQLVTQQLADSASSWFSTAASVASTASGGPPIPPGSIPSGSGQSFYGSSGGGGGFGGKVLGGGKGVVQNFYISTPDAGSFKRSQRQIADDARRALAGR